jgi:hypothetical protein
MRLGLDLRNDMTSNVIERAREADRLGLWAVLVGGTPGTENLITAQLATLTDHVHLAVWLSGDLLHPLALAEEIAVTDHLSQRRALAIIDGDEAVTEHVRRLLAGHIVNGVALAPPPAQTSVGVWSANEVSSVALTGDLDHDRVTIDEYRDRGHTHLFVSWPGAIRTLARHLATRAAGPGFPQITADHADEIAP